MTPLTATFCAIERHVLGVHVEDRVAERANRGRHVDALPEEMTRIEIDAEVRPGRLPQLQRRLDVVDDEAGMRLERHLHAVVRGERAPPRSSTESPSFPTASRARRGTPAATAS